ncbi:MAG: hypothetical protein ABMA13_06030 [Chthoniobacteraceae bacterium]
MVTRLLFILLASASLAFAAAKGETQSSAREPDYYKIITLPTPEGVTFEAGALSFLGPDKLACASRIGEIWIAEGVLGDAPTPKWTLFASGLHEVLGLATRPGDKDGWLYATQRPEVTRIRDTNGDGRADEFETFSDAWSIAGDYHEYAFGSKFDREGNMWVVLCLTGSFHSDHPYRGWALRITPEGKAIPACAGVRSPGGIGFNSAGDLFYTDNQGPWNGSDKLQQIVPGAFLGHPDGIKWFDDPKIGRAIADAGLRKPARPEDKSRLYIEAKKIPELLPPAVYFPYPKMGQSASGFACDMTGGKFGPFKDQLFVGDQSHSTVMRVALEKVNGHYQGACFPFRAGFASGSLGLEFAQDGSLVVYGTDRGWGARGGKPYALQRLVWTGKVPFEIHEMRVKPDGFELTFTEPVDPKTAADPASYTMETYTYIYQETYGSPEVDPTTPKIVSVKVAPDGRSARLVLSELAEGHVHELHAPGVRSAKGDPLLHDAAYYTLFYIPKP